MTSPPSPSELDDRLADLLARSAAAVDVHPDLDVVTRPDAVVVALDDRPSRTRRRLALASAAVLLVVFAAAAVALSRDDAETIGVTDGSPARLFPSLDGLPDTFDGRGVVVIPAEGQGAAVVTPLVDPSIPSVQTVVARSSGLLGDWEDAVVVEAVATRLPDRIDGFAPTSIAGREVLVAEDERIVIVPGEATIVASGGSGVVAQVTALLEAGMEAVGGVDGPDLLIDRDAAAADDLEVFWPARDTTHPDGGELAVQVDGDAPAFVETGGEHPEAGLARRFGWWKQVSVREGQGASAAEGDGVAEVAWSVPPGGDRGRPWHEWTPVRVTVRGTIENALALAAHVRLVDEAEWRRTYDVSDAGPATATTTTPMITTVVTDLGASGTTAPLDPARSLVGQAAPPVEGTLFDGRPFLPGGFDEWTIVTFVASWCVPCRDQLEATAAYRDAHADIPVGMVSLVVDDERDAAAAFVDSVGVDWPVILLDDAQADAWALDDALPEVLIIDPDGIVRAHLGGVTSPDEIAERLADLGAT